MNRVFTVGSLFSGIGGFDLGLERTGGFQTRWFCEQDKFCAQVLNKHWPGVPVYPDVTTLRGGQIEPVDVLCGGFPCQDLSVAGKGAGITGERSGLWKQYARLIGELRPRYVFVENVPALRSRGFGVVLGDLAALGYDTEWDCLPASAFGAPHQRDRIWIVAYPRGERALAHTESFGRERWGIPGILVGEARASEADGEQLKRDGDAIVDSRAVVADTDRGRQPQPQGCECDERGRFGDSGEAVAHPSGIRQREPSDETDPITGEWEAWEVVSRRSWWEAEPPVGRVADGFPGRVAELRALGNALVPQIAEWIGGRVMDYEQARADQLSLEVG